MPGQFEDVVGLVHEEEFDVRITFVQVMRYPISIAVISQLADLRMAAEASSMAVNRGDNQKA
ncbi:hypothetical protein [Variovorax sp. efr-133-TYG-130]|uniref:hypothetical protein n=1 Tax=Variovorax sp. efr-133-TYG-130 TaxID=3040327 RepID=UPI002552D68A|nr:hypothetical protein [Variovorax sp. efr-133-TYG-130]